MDASLQCQFDHLVIREGAIFAYGWCVRGEDEVSDAVLEVDCEGGRLERVRVVTGLPREDVALTLPNSAAARFSGFMVVGGWAPRRAVAANIRFTFKSGHVEVVPVEIPRGSSDALVRRAGATYRIRRALSHVLSGQWGSLATRAREFRRRNTVQPHAELGELSGLIAGARLLLVIDHSMGGGANLYRDDVLSKWTEDRGTAILLTFNVPSLMYRLEVHRPERPAVTADVPHLQQVESVLGAASLVQVLLNCAVSMPSPGRVLELVQSLVTRTGARLSVALHDYFCVCPSPFLLDYRGQFCGVPSLERCESCLPAHDDGYATLAEERSVPAWRQRWGALLHSADEVRCFSTSSARILARAYPDLGARVSVVPHEVAPLRRVRLTSHGTGRIVIGVVGAISSHKGAEVVVELAKAIEASRRDIRIVVIGRLEGACPASVVTQTGPYEREQLPELVERWGIGMVLMPSICPETFSFVSHEVVLMGIPLMTLDLGAQAEVARGYRLGHVARDSSGAALMVEIEEFVARLRGNPVP